MLNDEYKQKFVRFDCSSKTVPRIKTKEGAAMVVQVITPFFSFQGPAAPRHVRPCVVLL